MRSVGDTFREEALELLGELEIALLELEERPQDGDAVGRVFRVLHTIKGSGAMAGFEAVAAVAHEIETVFERIRSGEMAASRELVSHTLAARDRLKTMIEGGDEAECAEHVAAIAAKFSGFLPHEEASTATGRPPGLSRSPAEAVTYRIRFRPTPEIFRRGINPATLLRELAHLGDCRVVAQVDTIPPLTELDPELCYLYWDVILTTEVHATVIRDVFLFVEGDSEVTIEAIDLPEATTEVRRLGEILVERGDLPLSALQSALQERRRLGEVRVAKGLVDGGKIASALAEQEQVEKIRRERQVQDLSSSIRVRSDKLDSLVDLVGELVTVQARLSQLAARKDDAELVAVAEDVERLTWQMRDQVLGIRMLPIGSTFSKFWRLVRDLSAELGKDIELTTEGAETELDKTVIDRLYDPLVHLIRNGIDHGIESPSVRSAAGKPARGRICLSASHAGPNVLIRISDDGRGFDRDAIKSRAVAKGLVPAGAELTDKEIFALTFLPGLSTAASVTSVSGRGVGMDVVKQAIEELRGSVDIESRPGAGTTFTVKLPLTLAIIDGLLVQVGNDQFVLPLSSVEECIELKRVGSVKARERHLVNVRGQIVPYIRLREQFAVGGEPPAIEQIVIAETEGQRVGFVVDHVIGSHQTVIKSLGHMYREVAGLSGATILGDGTVALILDVPRLIASAEFEERAKIASNGGF
jgi:two-component system chemotaxis sensor kinase CheA